MPDEPRTINDQGNSRVDLGITGATKECRAGVEAYTTLAWLKEITADLPLLINVLVNGISGVKRGILSWSERLLKRVYVVPAESKILQRGAEASTHRERYRLARSNSYRQNCRMR